MRIIISAYECSPNHGSEAGLGWKWVLSSSRYTEFEKVHVITTDRYEKNIKQYVLDHGSEMEKINFHFLPLPFSRLKRLNQRFKYIIWQWLVGNLAKEICQKEQIDFMHHVTWATCVLPTFLYRGNRPFVYGPIGGGERIPECVNIRMSKRDVFVEWIRNALADISVFFPASKRAYQRASLILSTTEETKNLIPKKFHSKVRIMQAIGINELPTSKREHESDKKDFIVLLAARMLCWKGIDIAIEAFKKMERLDSGIKLLIAGVGRNFDTYKHMAEGLSNIEFLGGVPHSEMEDIYRDSDILLNCSLHDSGCMVVLEAMSYGLPIITIRTGGPAVLADESCAIMIEPKSVSWMIDEICQSILILKNNKAKRDRMSVNARKRVQMEFMYDQKYNQIIRELKGTK